MTETKTWNSEPYWGLGYGFDLQWLLAPAQKELQAKLIDLGATVLCPNAIASDANLIYP